MASEDLFEKLQHIAPQAFVVIFPLSTQLLSVLSTTDEEVTWSLFGNWFSWIIVAIMFLWAYASLRVYGKEYKGPMTSFGFTPIYKANGLQYFTVTASLFSVILYISPALATKITRNFPQILASCNIAALGLCYHLFQKGKLCPENKEELVEKPTLYEFYRGMELHPRIFNVDVKQLTNCRFGLMAWFLLVEAFFVANWQSQGFSLALFLCCILKTLYLGKFFWWETGYFNTLDITLDRAGFYICWGCIVWVPCLYTYSFYFLSSRPVLVGNNGAWLLFFFGIIMTVLNYWVDWEKEYFRKCGGKCKIWGRVATFINAPYKTHGKGVKKSQLLTSGFWGVARHLNYLFEILVAFTWSMPCLGYGVWPFIYPIFLTILLVHRVFRDERKCKAKYGQAWDQYCQKVPYRLIPGIF